MLTLTSGRAWNLLPKLPPPKNHAPDATYKHPAIIMTDESPKDSHHKRYSHVSLLLWGDRLNPNEITKSLRFEPTESYVIGQEMHLSSGKTYAKRTGQWIYETRDDVDSVEFQVHINYLLDKLGHIYHPLHRLAGVDDASVACIVGPNQAGWTEEFMISRQQVSQLALLGLGLDFAFLS